jgi:hypothetical protein
MCDGELESAILINNIIDFCSRCMDGSVSPIAMGKTILCLSFCIILDPRICSNRLSMDQPCNKLAQLFLHNIP